MADPVPWRPHTDRRTWAHAVCAVFDCSLGRSDGAGLRVWTRNDLWMSQCVEKFAWRWVPRAIALFLVLRGFNLYGDPRPWVAPAPSANAQSQNAPHPSATASTTTASPAAQQSAPATPPRRPQAPAWISFLNTTKYPASLLFLLMTLGPMLLVLPFLENAGGRATGVLKIFGRVPFFYYVLHIPLIHLAAVIVSLLRTGSVAPWLFMNHPVMNPPSPPGYVWSLGLLYLVWVIVVTFALHSVPMVCGTEAAEKGHRVPQLFVSEPGAEYAF